MSADIIIYAVIAIVLLARLWSVFGQRSEDEPNIERQNPFSGPFAKPPLTPASKTQDEENVVVLEGKSKQQESKILAPLWNNNPAPDSLAGALAQIKNLDPLFDEKQFLQGARAAFTLIVSEFAKGEMAQIESLLAPQVLYSFRQVLEQRRSSGEVLETRVEQIVDAEVASARVEDRRAFITVDFISRQINVARDARGTVVSGTPDVAEEIHDSWVFSRDLAHKDPNWILTETKG